VLRDRVGEVPDHRARLGIAEHAQPFFMTTRMMPPELSVFQFLPSASACSAA
jgi:hypothetical protein